MSAAPINHTAAAAAHRRRTRQSLWRLTEDTGDKVASWLEDLGPESLEQIPAFPPHRHQQHAHEQIKGHRHYRSDSSTRALALRNAIALLNNQANGASAFSKVPSHNRSDSLPLSDASSSISIYSDEILPSRSISRLALRDRDERFYAHPQQQSLSKEREAEADAIFAMTGGRRMYQKSSKFEARPPAMTRTASAPSWVLTSSDGENLSHDGGSSGHKTPELCDDTSEITIEDLLEQCRTEWRKSFISDSERPPTPPPKSPNLLVRGLRRMRSQPTLTASTHSKSTSESSHSAKSFTTAAEPSSSPMRPFASEVSLVQPTGPASATSMLPNASHPYRFRQASAVNSHYLTPPASPLPVGAASPSWSLFSTKVFIDEDFRPSKLSRNNTRELSDTPGFHGDYFSFPLLATASSQKHAPAKKRAPPPSAPPPSAPLPSEPSRPPRAFCEPPSAPVSSTISCLPGARAHGRSPEQPKKQPLHNTKPLNITRRVKIRLGNENAPVFKSATPGSVDTDERPDSALSWTCRGDDQQNVHRFVPGTPKLSSAEIEDYFNTVHVSHSSLPDVLPVDHDDAKPAPFSCALPIQGMGKTFNDLTPTAGPTTPLGNLGNLISLFPALPARHSPNSSFLPLAGGRRR